jgi:hypothetical protein
VVGLHTARDCETDGWLEDSPQLFLLCWAVMAYEGDTRWAETLHSRLERSICDEGSAVRVVDGVVGTEGAE